MHAVSNRQAAHLPLTKAMTDACAQQAHGDRLTTRCSGGGKLPVNSAAAKTLRLDHSSTAPLAEYPVGNVEGVVRRRRGDRSVRAAAAGCEALGSVRGAEDDDGLVDSKPSISVRIWSRVCSRSSLAPVRLERTLAGATDGVSSSMKMIDGAASLALLTGHARAAPTPTIASMNSGHAAIEKYTAHASPATGGREQRLAGSRRAVQQHAVRDATPELDVLVRGAQEVTISASSAFASSIPATSSNVTMIFCGSTRRAWERPKLPRKPEPLARDTHRASRMNRTTINSVGANPISSSAISYVFVVGDLALTCTPFDCRRLVRVAPSQNDGTSVENNVVGVSPDPDVSATTAHRLRSCEAAFRWSSRALALTLAAPSRPAPPQCSRRAR